jgi:N-dimethylarginine dimethylaminohydrolase
MYNYNAPWHPLKKTCLGRSYSSTFYLGIRNSRIRDTLMRIAEETEQDYQGIQRILEQAGVEVVRPDVPVKSILDYTDRHGRITHATAHSFTLIPRPPMQPRDCHLVVGNQFLATNKEIDFYATVLDTTEITTSTYVFDAPYVTVIGQDLVVDRRDYPGLDQHIQQQFPDRRVVAVDIGGHNDSVFAPVRPGLIVSTYDNTNYANTFPGWKVLYIERQSWNAIPEWRQLKHSNLGKWWMPGEETNTEFTQFVETWLTNWLGYVEETVFDVNMLSLDEHTVLVNNYNREVFEFFKSHHIEPVIAPFRHRFFWDGGIHCITSDLYREGEAETYIKR